VPVNEILILGLTAVWSFAFLAAVLVAVSAHDAAKRADARKVMHMLGAPWTRFTVREEDPPATKATE
jgi:hypothetical protein